MIASLEHIIDNRVGVLIACYIYKIKITMHHRSTATDSHSTVSQTEKNLSAIVDNLKQRELILKRDHIISSILEDAPKSFTKLISKDLSGNHFHSEERIKMFTKQFSGTTGDGRAKHANKNFFKALQEQQRIISRENMQMLGLTIQKIGYIPKNCKGKFIQTSGQPFETVQPCEVINLENNQNILERQNLINKRTMSHHRPRGVKKRPQSIRVRGKESISPEKRRQSLKPINSEYQNTIYEARIVSYRELLFKLQWTYGIYSEMDSIEQFRSDKKYKVWIGGGNNSPLIRELMKRRFWWQITEQRGNLQVNFVWTQLKVSDYFQKQPTALIWNLNQNLHKLQQPKAYLTKQSSKELNSKPLNRRQRQKQRQRLQDQQYLFKIMPQIQSNLYKSMIRAHRAKPLYQRQKLICKKEVSGDGEKVHNHFTANFHLGNKKALFYNLKEYYELTGGNLFKAIPLTFHIKKGTKDPQYKRFLAYYKKRQMHIKKQEKEMENGEKVKRPLRNIWIVKPGELTNRGNGITVIDEVYQLDAIMKSEKKHDNGTEKTFIVQLYIDRPFLYRRRKFDIRHYLLISQIHGVFKAYWYKEGYIRTSSYEFDVFNFDREIHLTNDAVQKYLPHYGRYEPANKLSYAQFQKYLDGNYKEKYNFQEQILPRMKEITLDAVRSTFVKLSPQRLKHNFQIFGLDFMIDSDFVPWLIQVNTNPCLELACPLLTRLIPQMVDQALRLTLDVIYPPPTHYPNTSKHLVPDASLQSLKWQLFFDQRLEGQQLKQLYRRCKGDLMAQIGEISDDEVYQDLANNQVPLNEIL